MSAAARFILSTTTIALLCVANADAHGLRFFGRLLPPRNRCEPMISACVPAKVSDPKEEPLPAVDKDLRVNVKNIARLLKAKKPAQARKLAEAVVPTIDDLSDLMHLYRPRNKGGLGFGPVPGKNPALDGLEKGILNVAKKLPAKIENLAPQYEDAAYWIAALAELTIVKAPSKDGPGLRFRKSWLAESGSLRQAALDLADAVVRDSAKVQPAAIRINNACVACHTLFKE